MSLSKVNNYQQGNEDLSNLAENVDFLRKSIDLTYIEESGGSYYVKVGSIFEYDGDTYIIQDTDEVISGTLSINQINNIYFNGSTFSFSLTAPVYNNTKSGYYNGTDKALRWVVTGLSSSTYVISLIQRENVFFNDDIIGDVNITGDLEVDGTLRLSGTEILYSGTVTVNNTYTLIESDISAFLNDFTACNYSFTGGTPTNAVIEVFIIKSSSPPPPSTETLIGSTTTSSASGTFNINDGDVNNTNIIDLYVRITNSGTALPCSINIVSIKV